MKFKIAANAEIDTLTKQELLDGLRAWHAEVIKGARPVLFSFSAQVTGAALTCGGDTGPAGAGQAGPSDGFVWAVARIAQTGLAIATDPTSIFIGNAQPHRLVLPNFTGNAAATGYATFSKQQLVLQDKQKLLVASTGAIGTANGTTVTISGAAWELPVGLLWQIA